jgi:hypothetical protein
VSEPDGRRGQESEHKGGPGNAHGSLRINKGSQAVPRETPVDARAHSRGVGIDIRQEDVCHTRRAPTRSHVREPLHRQSDEAPARRCAEPVTAEDRPPQRRGAPHGSGPPDDPPGQRRQAAQTHAAWSTAPAGAYHR